MVYSSRKLNVSDAVAQEVCQKLYEDCADDARKMFAGALMDDNSLVDQEMIMRVSVSAAVLAIRLMSENLK